MHARLATLHELGSSLGVEDVYDLLEIMAVEAHNRRCDAQAMERG